MLSHIYAVKHHHVPVKQYEGRYQHVLQYAVQS